MLKIDTLKEVLDIDQSDLKSLNEEKLRLTLGVLRYASRLVVRELNERECDPTLTAKA